METTATNNSNNKRIIIVTDEHIKDYHSALEKVNAIKDETHNSGITLEKQTELKKIKKQIQNNKDRTQKSTITIHSLLNDKNPLKSDMTKSGCKFILQNTVSSYTSTPYSNTTNQNTITSSTFTPTNTNIIQPQTPQFNVKDAQYAFIYRTGNPTEKIGASIYLQSKNLPLPPENLSLQQFQDSYYNNSNQLTIPSKQFHDNYHNGSNQLTIPSKQTNTPGITRAAIAKEVLREQGG